MDKIREFLRKHATQESHKSYRGKNSSLVDGIADCGRFVPSSATTDSGAESQAALKKQTTVTETQAIRIALAKVVKGTVKSSELEKKHRKLIWSFDIAAPKTRNITEVQVDAKTGKLVAMQIEFRRSKSKRRSLKNRTTRAN